MIRDDCSVAYLKVLYYSAANPFSLSPCNHVYIQVGCEITLAERELFSAWECIPYVALSGAAEGRLCHVI